MVSPPTMRPARSPRRNFIVGYNQNTISGKYGRDMTEEFAISDFDMVFDRAKAGGGRIVRIWLFEGYKKEGIDFGQDGKKPLGLYPGFLDNVDMIMQHARSKAIKVYWTALSGNWKREWDNHDERRWRQIHYNLLNNRFQSNDDFLDKCLLPLINRLNSYRSDVYALDIMNEFQGSERFWPDPWIDNACAWIRKTCDFVHTHANWLKVTVSAQGRGADDSFKGSDCILSHLRDLPIDFYDLHQYNDEGTIYRANELKELTSQKRKEIILGEFGQRSSEFDDDLKNRITRGFLTNARDYGFSAGIAWILNDNSRHTYYRNGEARPAVAIARDFVRNA